MERHLTIAELASLMKTCAGLTVAPEDMAGRPDATFADFGLDSLGLLGIVGELENRYGTPIAPGAEMCRTPAEFTDVVNASLTTGV